MSAKIIRLSKGPRPLRKTYQPAAPYEVEREDQEDGSILYHVVDMRPESYRTLASCDDYLGSDSFAKHDAEQIARGLNMLVQYGMEQLPTANKRTDDFDLEEET